VTSNIQRNQCNICERGKDGRGKGDPGDEQHPRKSTRGGKNMSIKRTQIRLQGTGTIREKKHPNGGVVGSVTCRKKKTSLTFITAPLKDGVTIKKVWSPNIEGRGQRKGSNLSTGEGHINKTV